MERKRIAILVDFENIHDFSVPKAESYEISLYLFAGAKQKFISIELLRNILSRSELNIIQVATIGDNSLDFSLAVEMGILHKTEAKEVEFYVLSKDKGFDFAVEYLKKRHGRKVKRVESLEFLVTPEARQKTSKSEQSKILNQFYQKYTNFLNTTAHPISKREEGAKNQIRSFFRVENLNEVEINYLFNRLKENGFIG
jgi:hypothetical protein